MTLLTYRTIGQPSHKPLLFLHGLGAGAVQTTSAFPALPNTYLIAPDMPGHGDSQDFPPQELNFDRFADHVVELMDELNIKSCDIGGLSMGAGITLNLASRFPERLQKMILLRPSWLHQKMPEHLKLVAYVGQWIEQFGIDAAREKLLADPDFQRLDQKNKPVANSIGGLFQRPVTPASTSVLYKMWQDAPFPSLDELATITHPALVLSTSKDELHPPHTADMIASHLPNLRHQNVLPPRYHEPDAYALALNTIIQKFLTQ
ncbi:MAG: alpha/beta hydrolase [Verrucomicrobiae bacterium]|nr:alpha/beta hydrolase [Verrucomicrobiae bacterium]NNJ42951.1 alpha/beta hydrolase [Akkermansiaceae bacterium]